MFESLIREAASRFHLGDNAGRIIRMLTDAVFNSGTGGFEGMRSRFDEAGLGDLFASWIGTTPGDNVLQPDQFSAGYGSENIGAIASRLGVPAAAVSMAGAWLLPKIVGLVTPGGTIPTARPADYDSWFSAPLRPAPAAAAATSYATAASGAVAGSTAATTAAASGGGWWKWLLGLVVLGALLFFGLRSCQGSGAPDAAGTPDAGTAASTEAPATDAMSTGDAAVPTDTGALPADSTAAPPADAPPADGTDTAGAGDPAAAGGTASGEGDAAAALSGLAQGGSLDDLLKALNLMIIHFDTGSANISRESLDILGKAAEAIKAMPAGTRIDVGGHTDNTGNAAANQTLSQRRADAVVAKLGELGVAAGTLTGKGHGQDQPKADNGTEEGRAQNRRIEFTAGQ